MVGSQQCLMISLTLILCLVPIVQHPQSMSRRVRRPTRWNLQPPGIKKEYCRVGINDEGNLTIAIENKQGTQAWDKHHHYLRREVQLLKLRAELRAARRCGERPGSAKVEDGILTITMPKRAEPKEKVVSVSVP